MRTGLTVFSLLLMLFFSTISVGCMGLVMQREIMEDMREEPFVINKDESFFWEVIFTSESLDLDSVQYTNETPIDFDDTISKMSITFRAEFPYSTLLDLNESNELRYIEVRVWEPGVKESGGNPYWEVRATQDYPLERFDFSDLAIGKWTVEIDARGYGADLPLEQLSFHDYFEMTLTITKPCVQFAEIHQNDDCTDLSVLESQ